MVSMLSGSWEGKTRLTRRGMLGNVKVKERRKLRLSSCVVRENATN